jgi:hypothetical protein
MAENYKGGSGSSTWLSQLWESCKSWLWIGGIGLLALVILPIFFPFLKPVFDAIWAFIGNCFKAVTPVFGWLSEWLQHLTTKTAVTQVVNSQETFKTLLGQCAALSDAQKQIVLSLLAQANNQEQDTKTQNVVSTVKAQS